MSICNHPNVACMWLRLLPYCSACSAAGRLRYITILHKFHVSQSYGAHRLSIIKVSVLHCFVFRLAGKVNKHK